MLHQDLQGKLPHMIELPWKHLAGNSWTRALFVEIEGVRHEIGQASGRGYNCLLFSLQQCLGVDVNVALVRADLQKKFPDPCREICSPEGTRCLQHCKKVYAENYLCDSHCLVLALAHNPGAAASSSAAAPVVFNIRDFCVRVIELRLNSSSGCVKGPPTATVKLTLARENGNHFVPVLRCRSPA